MNDANITGNFYNKYESKNPIERKMMKDFFYTASELMNIADKNQIANILETGCGEGHFTAFIRSQFPNSEIDAFDIGEDCINQAVSKYSDLNINFCLNSIYEPELEENTYDMVCASEVMEHLEDPIKALRNLEKLSKAYVFISVPNEPLWRFLNMCRIKYLKDFGNTPGHIQHWNQKSFLKMVEENTSLKCVKAKKSLPWLLFIFKKEN